MPHLNRSYFLGKVVYYQKFIEQCSVIASKLFQLIAGPMGQRWKKGKKTMTKRPLTAEDWTDDCRQALRCLKPDGLCFIGSSRFQQAILVSVDASSSGLVLNFQRMPENGDTAMPVYFASKSLLFTQSKYPAHRLEFFCIEVDCM